VPTAEPILVLGAGAIGSLYAAKLAARHPVTIVARPGHVEAIRLHGLRLTGRELLTAPVDAVTQVDTIAAGTIILLTTKVNDSEAAISAVADRLRDDTVIVCLQNGLHSEAIARRAVHGRCRVLRAITQFGAIFQAPSVVEYTVAGHTLLEKAPPLPIG
jgi:2-dehydropantoate 2-reductase